MNLSQEIKQNKTKINKYTREWGSMEHNRMIHFLKSLSSMVYLNLGCEYQEEGWIDAD